MNFQLATAHLYLHIKPYRRECKNTNPNYLGKQFRSYVEAFAPTTNSREKYGETELRLAKLLANESVDFERVEYEDATFAISVWN